MFCTLYILYYVLIELVDFATEGDEHRKMKTGTKKEKERERG